mgnify:CR=1 FL=1
MSLFDKMKKHQPPEKPNDGEFKSDVNTILHGTSVQNRKEMCELEYMKARRLLKNPTVETVARAKNIMNTLATDFDYLPAVLWMAEFSVNGVKNPEQAAMWYKKSRRPWQCEWSVQNCRYSYGRQRCTRNPKLAMEYYKIAANNGIASASFALGEYYAKTGNREEAVKAYEKAVKGGYKDAEKKLAKLKKKF